MERNELARVFFGDGNVPPPWASECPVKFDAWEVLAQPSTQGIAREADLILTVAEQWGVSSVLEQLWNLQVGDAKMIAAENFIVARLALPNLIGGVLPITSLVIDIRRAQQLGDSLIEIVEVLDERNHVVLEQTADDTRWEENNARLMWFLRLLRVVVEAAMAPELDADANPRAARRRAASVVIDMLQSSPSGHAAEIEASSGVDPYRRHAYPIVSVTSNRPTAPMVIRSRVTIKADAAEQLFSVDCSNVGWAVVDSGIDASHDAFADWNVISTPPRRLGCRVIRTFDFIKARDKLPWSALQGGVIDWTQALPHLEMEMPDIPPTPAVRTPMQTYVPPVERHGTHVAGILGGSWPARGFRAICPTIRLFDFRVVDENGTGDEFSILAALQAIRHINDQAGRLVIAGVNVSMAVQHDVRSFACGWTPVCIQCDRLVRSGIIVVAAAGNAGFAGPEATYGGGYSAMSISDPGNSDSVVTVGSTHRSEPHRNGVSYFSGRGPTADGRFKPDLLAPGEDIDGPIPGGGIAAMSGTSQAAAHVSGAAAMLVARYRELLGRPQRVKATLCETATDLGRERAFQGHGVIDVLRAMQAV